MAIGIYSGEHIDAWKAQFQADTGLQQQFGTAGRFISSQVTRGIAPAGFTVEKGRLRRADATLASAPSAPAVDHAAVPVQTTAPTKAPEVKMSPAVSDSARLAGIDALMSNVPPGNENRTAAAKIIEVAKLNGSTIGQAALALLESGVCASSEDQYRAVYGSSAALQREFVSADHYVAHRRYDVRKSTGRAPPAQSTAVLQGNEKSWSAEYHASAELQNTYVTVDHYLAVKRHEARRGR